MARIKELLIVTFILLFSQAILSSDWEGTWDDSCSNGECYGGRLKTCVSGNNIYGVYSKIGYIVGTIYGDRAIGNWYEAGFSLYNHGGFDWTIFPEGISGTWWYEDSKCLRNSWITPILNDTISNDECDAIIADLKESIKGIWTTANGDSLFICEQSNDYFVASGFLFGNEVYITGQLWEGESLASGNFWNNLYYNYDNNNNNNYKNEFEYDNSTDYYYDYSSLTQGITQMYINTNGDLILNIWGVSIASEAINSFDDKEIHTTLTFSHEGNNSNFSCDSSEEMNQLSWSGVFTDEEFGGYFYLCPTANKNSVQGIYSEIGWIEGNIRNKTLFGNWFTAGGDENNRGDFSITLSNDGLSFSGYYTSDRGFQNAWKGNRLDISSDQFIDRCFIIPEDDSENDDGNDDDFSVEGRWYYGKAPGDSFDICLTGKNEVEVSYSYNGGNSVGYATGFVSEGKSIQLTWQEDNSNGVAIYRLISRNRLVESFWANVEQAQEVNYAVCDDDELDVQYWGLHSVNHLIRISDRANSDVCGRYRFVDFSSSSNSSLLSISLFTFLLSLFLFV